MPEISFFTPGIPAPGGSKRPVRVGGKADGKLLLIDDCKGNAAWRERVAVYATLAYRGPLLDGPLFASFDFLVPRPVGHYGTGAKGGVLRPGAPAFPKRKPDLTKLVRAAEDALKGIIWTDDARIVTQHNSKRYGDPPGLLVTVRGMAPDRQPEANGD